MNNADQSSHADLAALALRVREHIVRMAGGGGCFIGASLSCADILVYLYARVLHVAPSAAGRPREHGAPSRADGDWDRDYFFLSKGHDVPALYGTLAELGFIDPPRLANHLKPGHNIYWHPNRGVPGVEFHSGSLGHLLSVAVGVALDIKLRGGRNKVFVLLGDGELDEGSIWEACLVAHAHKLDNLVAVIDRNEFQANARTEDLVPLEPLDQKLRAFGWTVRACDGHDFSSLEAAFAGLTSGSGKPVAIIARTVRGKGLPSIEQRADRWFVSFSPDEVEGLLRELHGEGPFAVTSEVLMVR